jgi:hypothetical protein
MDNAVAMGRIMVDGEELANRISWISPIHEINKALRDAAIGMARDKHDCDYGEAFICRSSHRTSGHSDFAMPNTT